jgi:ribosomal protein S19
MFATYHRDQRARERESQLFKMLGKQVGGSMCSTYNGHGFVPNCIEEGTTSIGHNVCQFALGLY